MSNISLRQQSANQCSCREIIRHANKNKFEAMFERQVIKFTSTHFTNFCCVSLIAVYDPKVQQKPTGSDTNLKCGHDN